MHPILRKSIYQTDASLSVIGSTPSYDQGAVLWGADQVCEHYEVSTCLGICSLCIGHSLGHITPHNRIRMIVAYNSIYAAAGNSW